MYTRVTLVSATVRPHDGRPGIHDLAREQRALAVGVTVGRQPHLQRSRLAVEDHRLADDRHPITLPVWRGFGVAVGTGLGAAVGVIADGDGATGELMGFTVGSGSCPLDREKTLIAPSEAAAPAPKAPSASASAIPTRARACPR